MFSAERHSRVKQKLACYLSVCKSVKWFAFNCTDDTTKRL